MRNAILMSAIVAVGCGSASPQTQEFAYHRWATTGLQDAILVDGHTVFIKFRADSDKRSLDSLGQLDSPVQLDSTEVVMIEGELGHETLMTPKGKSLAESEPYREFKLLGWKRMRK